MSADPLLVACPACGAPAERECAGRVQEAAGGDPTTHEDRRRLADLRALEKGTCGLCGAFMVRGTVLGGPVEAWHPDETDAARCPQLPDPATDWDAYATALNHGARPGHPGVEHFRPDLNPDEVCPECRGDKHQNCTVTIPVGDGPQVLPCACRVTRPEVHA